MTQSIGIYKVSTTHSRYGDNWASYKIAARNCEEAIRKAKREFMRGERIESVNLLASTR